MNDPQPPTSARTTDARLHPFRRAILRGLAVLLPPLLTVVIFIWVWNTLREYVLLPVESGVTNAMIWTHFNKQIKDADPNIPAEPYTELADGRWIPTKVYEKVRKNPGAPVIPNTAAGVFRRYIRITYLPWWVVGPVFIGGLLIILSVVGRLLAAGVGRMLWNAFDRVVHQLPVVRNVYGSVKQVTDFLFSEREIQFTRVVAVEYPRKGIWSLGFVTSESLLDIHSAANEPMVTLLIPTSPIPGTGFTVSVKKSEMIDLNITIDQALQFIISCGVVVPPHQQAALAGQKHHEKPIGTASENGQSASEANEPLQEPTPTAEN